MFNRTQRSFCILRSGRRESRRISRFRRPASPYGICYSKDASSAPPQTPPSRALRRKEERAGKTPPGFSSSSASGGRSNSNHFRRGVYAAKILRPSRPGRRSPVRRLARGDLKGGRSPLFNISARPSHGPDGPCRPPGSRPARIPPCRPRATRSRSRRS